MKHGSWFARLVPPLVRPAWVLSALLLVMAPAAAETPSPQQVIDKLHALLLDTLRNAESLGIDGRYQKLNPQLGQFYNFERMISVAAGSAWTAGTPEQREKLLQAFANWSAMTYAARFNNYTGETFEVIGERPGPRQTVFVDTRINRPSEGPVAITYVMAENSSRWQIVDVLLQGSISELAQRRNDFSASLRAGGLPKLTEALNAKTEQLRTP